MAAGLNDQPSEAVQADVKHEESREAPAASGPAPAVLPTTTLEADDDEDAFDDNDSALGSLHGSSDSRSLTESVTDYRFEHGRRYHSPRAGDYHLPNDETEQDRLDFQHQIFRIALDNRSFFSPIPTEKIRNVLDIGCGTGVWCMDVANQLPDAKVEGIDISPIQPAMVPPNCYFYVDDCNSDWVGEQRYDLIHTGALTLAVTDWAKLIERVYEALRPGGYIELHEYYGLVECRNKPDPPEPYLVQLSKYIAEAMQKMGRDFNAPPKLGDMLRAAGFVDVEVATQEWPVGTWPKGRKNKTIGAAQTKNMKEAARNSVGIFTRVLGWQLEEFQVFSARVAQEVDAGELQEQTTVYFIHARKPEVGEEH